MEMIKNAVGLGKKEQSGQEPVSGQKGVGTAAEPFDQGNSEDPDAGGKAPQHTDASADTTTSTTAATDSATPLSGKSDAPDPNPVSAREPYTEAKDSTKASSSSNASPAGSAKKVGGIGSSGWFSTALPTLPFLGRGKKVDGKADSDSGAEAVGGITGASDTTATATAATGEEDGTGAVDTTKDASGVSAAKEDVAPAPVTAPTVGDETALPPNHLGENVPSGASTDLAEPEPVEVEQVTTGDKAVDSTQDPGDAAPQASSAEPNATTSAAEPAQAENTVAEPTKEKPSSSGGGGILGALGLGGSSKSDNAPAPSETPDKPTVIESAPVNDMDIVKPANTAAVENPSAIPTAGGKPLGIDAAEERGLSSQQPRERTVEEATVGKATEAVPAMQEEEQEEQEELRDEVPQAAAPSTSAQAPSVTSTPANDGIGGIGSGSSDVDSAAAAGGDEKVSRRRSVLNKVKGAVKKATHPHHHNK